MINKPKIDKIIHEAGVESFFDEVNDGYGSLPSTIEFTNPNGDGKSWKDYSFPNWVWDVNDDVYYSEATSPYKTAHGYISRIEFFNYSYKTYFRFYETPTETYTVDVNQEEYIGNWRRVKIDGSAAYVANSNVYIKTRGITYNIPEGTRYGFYIRVLNSIPKKEDEVTEDFLNAKTDFIIFSNANRNAINFYEDGKCINEKILANDWSCQTGWWTDDYDNYQESDKYAYASWGYGQMNGLEYTMFGFEDWEATNNNKGCDLNDIMFLFAAGEEPSHVVDTKKPEPKSYEWLIAAEDLGGSYDWDFNDAVFAVTAKTIVDGENTTTDITVEPLAAGGTLPIYVMFNGELTHNGTTYGNGHHHIGPELHSWLNPSAGLTQLNVRSNQQEDEGEPITFTVNGEWSIAKHVDNGKWEPDIKGMGGFYVLVNPGKNINHYDAGITTFEGNLDDEKNVHVVTPPTNYEGMQDVLVVAPEMLCLQNTWCWPMEEQPISDVYQSFKPWLSKQSETWYGANHTVNDIATGRTVKRKARP